MLSVITFCEFYYFWRVSLLMVSFIKMTVIILSVIMVSFIMQCVTNLSAFVQSATLEWHYL